VAGEDDRLGNVEQRVEQAVRMLAATLPPPTHQYLRASHARPPNARRRAQYTAFRANRLRPVLNA
jgi:hypothetical protein